MNVKNSKKVKNIRDDDDSDIKNEEDFYLLFIESYESLRNFLFKIEKNTSLSLEKIN